MSFKDLIEKKNARLDKIPEEFLRGVKRSEREVYENIIRLLAELEVKDGLFVQSARNIEIAGEIFPLLQQALIGSEYTEAVTEFAREFDIQADDTFKYFKQTFELGSVSEAATAAVAQGKRNAIDLLLNREADSAFLSPLQQIIEQSVVNNASYSDTLSAIREFVEGTDEVESRLMRYSRGIAHDTFAITDRAVSSIYSDEIEAEWFFYSGDTIPTSRAFCRERHNQYFHYREIEAWGRGEKTIGMETPDKTGHWSGEIEGTNEKTIWSYAGGYNCGHSIMPVSVFDVPRAVIDRAISQGFYEPSERELELLEE